MPGSSTYESAETNFWSLTEQLSPTCYYLPNSAEEVAQAVGMFVENNCTFSIKGGGHSAIPGAANIEEGVAMLMQNLNQLVVSDDRKTVVIGPGNLMGDIYKGTDPYNLTAMAGRYSTVGTGVFIGAGFNYLFNKNGFAADNLVNFEVVLANATIVNANATSNPDLFKVLKGGNSNFGVVTSFTALTEETEGSIWGGTVYYNETYLEQVKDQVYDYHVNQAVNDVLTHIMPCYGYNGTTDSALSFPPIMYNAALDDFPEVFKGWADIPYYDSTTHNRQYYDLAVELGEGFADGLVQQQRDFTVFADKQLYSDLWDNFLAWCKGYQDIEGFYCFHVNMPITPRAVQQGIDKGGNILGLEGEGDRVMATIYFGVTFNNLSDQDVVFPAHEDFVNSQIEIAKERGLFHEYVMVTYCGYDQKALASYGTENVDFMYAVQEAYDPTYVFQKLVPGGQKLGIPSSSC
ncbi:hypothetical protein F5Y16DRAFT_412146 [Xylariaceae sp. FL0255]|nr:hypothetical protein F5Y16DRAFT_412146 [Xylariaceae sp. FL0255]